MVAPAGEAPEQSTPARIAADGVRHLKNVQLTAAMLALLVAAACHRQAGNTATATAPGQASLQDDGGSSHDPHAMTAIDVATGDIAGFAQYAGGRTYAPPPSHTAGVPAVATAPLPTLPVATVAAGDEQPSALPLIVPPSIPANGGQTPPNGAPGPPAP
jgi:hypothetical protein